MGYIKDMAEENDFNQQLLEAIKQKAASINSDLMGKIQSDYRMHHLLVQSLFEALVKRSVITPDPYKKDKKISDIKGPESSEFSDSERSIVLGTRLSDYESTLDFICNFVRFNTDSMTVDMVNKLLSFNATFLWGELKTNSSRPNTKALAECISAAKAGAQQLTVSTLVDAVSKSADAIERIDTELNQVAQFIREKYKGDVRKNVLCSPQFNKQKAYADKNSFMAEIKRLYSSVMPRKVFSQELVSEIIQEEIGTDKESRRSALMAKLRIETKKKEKKVVTVDTLGMLMDAVRCFGAMSETYNVICNKIVENSRLLQGERNTFKQKIFRFIRKTFGIKEPPLDYEITVTDKVSGEKHKEIVHYNEFIANLVKRSKYYASISTKGSAGYNKVASQNQDAIFDFLTTQISENGRVHVVLAALDDFFKNKVSSANKTKIKGIQMELTTLKNTIVNINSHCNEYKAYRDEQAQLKKLGIINA